MLISEARVLLEEETGAQWRWGEVYVVCWGEQHGGGGAK